MWSSGFNAILLEGFFNSPLWEGDGALVLESILVEDRTGVQNVWEVVKPFIGQNVQVSMHHLPESIDPTKWGGGCCRWQAMGRKSCPAGHHIDLAFLLNVVAKGTLEESGCLQVRSDAGQVVRLPFEKLVGHTGRLAMATVVDMLKMQDTLKGQPQLVEGMSLNALKDIANRLKAN